MCLEATDGHDVQAVGFELIDHKLLALIIWWLRVNKMTAGRFEQSCWLAGEKLRVACSNCL